jgi:hypothetical protein
MESRYSIGLLPKYKYRKILLLGFFHMLRPTETWSSTLIQKPKLNIQFKKGCWLRTITKNNKESYSDIGYLI